MDVSSFAAAMVGAQVGRLHGNAATIVEVIEAAQQNLTQLADAGAGLGQNLDIPVCS